MNDLLSAVESTSDYLRKTAAVYLAWVGTISGRFVIGVAAYAHTPGFLMFLFVAAVSALMFAGPLIRRADEVRVRRLVREVEKPR